jgi:hypothetical protein
MKQKRRKIQRRSTRTAIIRRKSQEGDTKRHKDTTKKAYVQGQQGKEYGEEKDEVGGDNKKRVLV